MRVHLTKPGRRSPCGIGVTISEDDAMSDFDHDAPDRQAAPPGGPAAQAYEYLVVDWSDPSTDDEATVLLNSYGVDGWVLQQFVPSGPGTMRAVFMRPTG